MTRRVRRVHDGNDAGAMAVNPVATEMAIAPMAALVIFLMLCWGMGTGKRHLFAEEDL